MKRNIYFCSFADSSIVSALKRIGEEADNFKLFKEIILYTEKDLPPEIYDQCQSIIEQTGSKRGYAYWSWKPAIIMDVLSKITEGDVLFYCDAGAHLNSNGKSLLKKYIKKAIVNDIWVSQLDNQYNDYAYTKTDTINIFKDKIKDPKILYTGQIQGGNIILTKNRYTLELISQWMELMDIKNLRYYDDSPSIAPNHKTFVENRHDQSLFSLLIKTNHAFIEDAEKLWYPYELWEICRLPILNMRDKNNKYPTIDYTPKLKWLIKYLRWRYHSFLNKENQTVQKSN